MFRKNGIYYLLYSNLTSWERNDNFYYTATSIEGPWEKQGLFCPEGSLTYNSQCSFVFSIIRGDDTLHMYMGDRWSFPRQASAATQVWLPLQTRGKKLSIPEYWPSWDFLKAQPPVTKDSVLNLSGTLPFHSNRKGDFISIPYDGNRIALVGESSSHGGYAHISVSESSGRVIYSSLVDFYSKVADTGIRFISPQLPVGDYVLQVEVSGEQPVWFSKKGDRFGSDDYWVKINGVKVLPFIKD
ncbi:hypothetical protein [Olivibacter sp. XZL3]|uniref:hypothetical protein n=1 Tax=Olivibacter sp. XZL3 TaxID=1735116 RepID=UPI0014170F42|nr:hypothetical protein [Olivibacter sp. XZL3]